VVTTEGLFMLKNNFYAFEINYFFAKIVSQPLRQTGQYSNNNKLQIEFC